MVWACAGSDNRRAALGVYYHMWTDPSSDERTVPDLLVGKRVQIYWDGDDRFYEGVVVWCVQR
jgi:hypothetical protein